MRSLVLAPRNTWSRIFGIQGAIRSMASPLGWCDVDVVHAVFERKFHGSIGDFLCYPAQGRRAEGDNGAFMACASESASFHVMLLLVLY